MIKFFKKLLKSPSEARAEARIRQDIVFWRKQETAARAAGRFDEASLPPNWKGERDLLSRYELGWLNATLKE